MVQLEPGLSSPSSDMEGQGWFEVVVFLVYRFSFPDKPYLDKNESMFTDILFYLIPYIKSFPEFEYMYVVKIPRSH